MITARVVGRTLPRKYIPFLSRASEQGQIGGPEWRYAMDPFALVFPAIAAIFIVGVVAGGLAALLQTRNARRDRMEMKRYLRKVRLTGG